MKKYRGIFIKNDNEIGLLREANRIVSLILDELEAIVRPGMQTMEFEAKACAMCEQFGVQPAFKGYNGFPFAVCCSVNEEVVHGFPSTRILGEGDIVSIDMGVVYQGFYGDSARTFPVGKITPEAEHLIRVTRESLAKGIEAAHPGNNLYDISQAVQKHVEGAGLSVVKRFVGHGIGRHLHEKPEVPNFVPAAGSGLGAPLRVGMALCIEPMVTIGSPEVDILSDRWTAVTRDGSLAAHFEHTIVLTSNGPEILSRSIS